MTTTHYQYCYLLRNTSDKTYIGCTGDYENRLLQHNGDKTGGALETQVLGRPWEFVAIVHGFTDGRKFESAWQNPSKSLSIRNSIGDREAFWLADRSRTGVGGALSVLKCLLNECEGDFGKDDLHVEFSSEEWRTKFQEAPVVADYVPNNTIPCMVNPSLVLSPNQQNKRHSEQAFRWEVLPSPEEVTELRGKTKLAPSEWRKLRKIVQLIERADGRDSFKDEWLEDILVKEYELFRKIEQQDTFYTLWQAFSNTLSLCKKNGLAYPETLEMLKGISAGFKQDDDMNGQAVVDLIERKKHKGSVEFLTQKIFNRTEEHMESQAPDANLIADLLEKIRNAKDIVPALTACDKRATRPRDPDTSISTLAAGAKRVQRDLDTSLDSDDHGDHGDRWRKRCKFTNQQERDIRDAYDQYGSNWKSIQMNYPSLAGLGTEQLKNKIKNVRKQKENKPPSGDNRKLRQAFTDEEDEAILNGVEKYSNGRSTQIPWQRILNDDAYKIILFGRSADSIKGRYTKTLQHKNQPAFRNVY